MSVVCKNLPGIPIKAESFHPLIRGPAVAKRVHSLLRVHCAVNREVRTEERPETLFRRQESSADICQVHICGAFFVSRLIHDLTDF